MHAFSTAPAAQSPVFTRRLHTPVDAQAPIPPIFALASLLPSSATVRTLWQALTTALPSFGTAVGDDTFAWYYRQFELRESGLLRSRVSPRAHRCLHAVRVPPVFLAGPAHCIRYCRLPASGKPRGNLRRTRSLSHPMVRQTLAGAGGTAPPRSRPESLVSLVLVRTEQPSPLAPEFASRRTRGWF
jgi:hypothetical protein